VLQQSVEDDAISLEGESHGKSSKARHALFIFSININV